MKRDHGRPLRRHHDTGEQPLHAGSAIMGPSGCEILAGQHNTFLCADLQFHYLVAINTGLLHARDDISSAEPGQRAASEEQRLADDVVGLAFALP